jgi:hypothetical protein
MIDCPDAGGPVFAVLPVDESEVLDLLGVVVSIRLSSQGKPYAAYVVAVVEPRDVVGRSDVNVRW